MKRKMKHLKGKILAWIFIICLMSGVGIILALQQSDPLTKGDDKAVQGKSEVKHYLVAASSIYTEEGNEQNQNQENGAIATPEIQASQKEIASRTSKANDIINFAKQFLNVKYVWGGISPSGFDCSGFVKYVFDKFGYKLNRVAADQAKEGTTVKKSDLQPGNLVFFDTNNKGGYINHVGIFIGDGKFIQASSFHSKVVISNLSDAVYTRTFVTARKIG